MFAQKRTVIAEKLDILKHQLENVKSPEHLLSLERKKYAENEAKQKNFKSFKKANKEGNKKVEKVEEKGKKTKKMMPRKKTRKNK